MSLGFSKPPSLFSSRCDLVTIIFATEYQLSSEGGAGVQEQLTLELKKRQLEAFVKFSGEDDTFTVYCVDVDADKVTKFFIPFMTGLFENDEEDLENDEEGLENDEEDLEKSDVGCDLISKTRSDGEHNYSSIDGIRLQSKFAWQPDDTNIPLEEVVPPDTRKRIESLTGCVLAPNFNERVIYIGGAPDGSCYRALHKLDVILKYFKTYNTNSINHVFYNETETNVRMELQTLASIKSKLEQTTVLDWLRYPEGCKKGYKELKRTFRIRCCVWNPVRKVHLLKKAGVLRPAVRGAHLGKEFGVWTDYEYKGRGNESLKGMIQSFLENPNRDKGDTDNFGNQQTVDWKANIMEWTRGIPAAPISTQLGSHQQTTPEAFKQDFPKGDAKSHISVSLEHVRPPNSYQICEKNVSTSILDRITSDPQSDKSRKASHFRLPKSLDSLGERLSKNAPTLLESNDGDFVAAEFDVMIPQSQRNTSKQCGKDGKNTPLSVVNKDTQATPQGLRINPTSTKKGHRQAPNPGKGKGIAARLISHMPMSSPPTPISQDPSEMFLKSIKEMSKVVLSLRNWRGNIRLEAQFGRILIRKSPERFLEPGNSFEAEMVIQHLLNEGPQQPMVNFTNILTTTPSEVQYLVEMKDAKGNLMWLSTEMRAVKYEFDWTDEKSKDSYQLEIDADTFISRVKFDSWTTGQVLVHCPMRLWDFSINASRFCSPNPDNVGLHSEICSSLCVPHNARKAKLEFMVGGEYSHMRLNGIRVRRNCQYYNSDKTSILNITEVIDLKLDSARLMVDGKRVFSASEYTTKSIPGYPHSWYEVGVMSTAAEAAFMGNETLEFGEESSWTEEGLQNAGVFSAICLPACEMVKKMDGVGYYNDNGVQVASAQQLEIVNSSCEATERNNGENSEQTYNGLPKDKDFW